MSFVDAGGIRNFKVVYWGTGLAGKATNLGFVHRSLPIDQRSELKSLATPTERTLFFDAASRRLDARVHFFTIPGTVLYGKSRELILKGVDAIVFVADSQRERRDQNVSMLAMLATLDVPIVFQYNKRDLPNAAPVAELDEQLNPRERPRVDAVAVAGTGVLETLAAVVESLRTPS